MGVDEAGRGPLAGPVVAGAVILDPACPITGINDSKKLSHTRREELYETITAQATVWAVGEATPEEIDRLNILGATHLAMRRALESLGERWTLALVDGDRPIGSLPPQRQRTVVRGDGKSASIGAASILAKVTRDRIMAVLDQKYPHFEFALHKGYPTPRHREAIIRHGMSPVHRRTFCRRLLTQTRLAL